MIARRTPIKARIGDRYQADIHTAAQRCQQCHKCAATERSSTQVKLIVLSTTFRRVLFPQRTNEATLMLLAVHRISYPARTKYTSWSYSKILAQMGRPQSCHETFEDFPARAKKVTYLALASLAPLDSAHWNLSDNYMKIVAIRAEITML